MSTFHSCLFKVRPFLVSPEKGLSEFIVWDRVSCSWDWPPTHCATKNDPELVIILLLLGSWAWSTTLGLQSAPAWTRDFLHAPPALHYFLSKWLKNNTEANNTSVNSKTRPRKFNWVFFVLYMVQCPFEKESEKAWFLSLKISLLNNQYAPLISLVKTMSVT